MYLLIKVFLLMKIQMKFKSLFTFRTIFKMFLFSTLWKWRIWWLPRNKAAPFTQTLLTSSLAIPTGKYSEIIVVLSIFMGLTLVRFPWCVILFFSYYPFKLQRRSLTSLNVQLSINYSASNTFYNQFTSSTKLSSSSKYDPACFLS